MVYKNNLAQPLNTYFDSHEGIYESVLEDTYDPKLIEPFINGEDVYGLVTMWNPCITHLNTDYLEEAGLSASKCGLGYRRVPAVLRSPDQNK